MPTKTLASARTFLFVPGNRPDRFDKALAVGADYVIIDLEDAVPADDKADARAAIAAWLSADKPVVIRINAASTDHFKADLPLLSQPGVCGVVLAKAETASALEALPVPVLPLIETAKGMANVDAIASANGVVRLIFGSIDFMVDIGVPSDGEGLNAFRSKLVLASRIAGIASPVDGVTTAFDDPGQLDRDTARALSYGFSARMCIHPRQVGPIHAAMVPSDEDVAWAKRVLEVAESANGGAVQLNGEMVDRPVILKAEGILSRVQT